MIAAGIGDFDNIVGLEGAEIDPRDPRGVVGIDEQPAPVGNPVGLRQLRVVGIVPGDEAVAGHHQLLAFFGVAVAVLRILRKHRDHPEETPRGKAAHRYLAAEAAGEESVEFVITARRDIDPGRGVIGGGSQLLRGGAGNHQCEDGCAGKQDETQPFFDE